MYEYRQTNKYGYRETNTFIHGRGHDNIISKKQTAQAHLATETWLILVLICHAFANSVDPNQLASEEANWSGSALFAIKYLNLYQ